MRKTILFVSILIFSISISYATQTRINSLGVSNWSIEDDFNIWFNPALIVKYNKMAFGELGTGGVPTAPGATTPNNLAIASQWGGINYDFGLGFGTFGFYLQRPYPGIIGGTGLTGNLVDSVVAAGRPFGAAGVLNATGITGWPGVGTVGFAALAPLAPVSSQFDILWGFNLSDGIALGASVNYASNFMNPSYEYKSATAAAGEGSASQKFTTGDLNITVGTHILNCGPFSTVEVVASYGIPNYEVTQNESVKLNAAGTLEKYSSKIESDTGANIGFLARSKFELSDNSYALTTIRYVIQNVSGKWASTSDSDGDGATVDNYDRNGTFTDKITTFSIDDSYNVWFSKNTLFIASVGFWSIVTDQAIDYTANETATNGKFQNDTYKLERIVLPVNVAVEHKISDTFTGRLGVTKWLFTGAKTTTSDNDWAAVGNSATKTTNTTIADAIADTGVMVTTGLGISIADNFKIDAMLRQQILFGGPYLISGIPNSMFGQLTAVYKF